MFDYLHLHMCINLCNAELCCLCKEKNQDSCAVKCLNYELIPPTNQQEGIMLCFRYLIIYIYTCIPVCVMQSFFVYTEKIRIHYYVIIHKCVGLSDSLGLCTETLLPRKADCQKGFSVWKLSQYGNAAET